MSARTPSPWVLGIRNDDTVYISMGNSRHGAHAQFDLGGTLADALLIAAAPDLLEACKKQVETCPCGGPKSAVVAGMMEADDDDLDLCEACQMTYAAIVKAEGR